VVGDSRSSVAPAPEHRVLSFPLPAPSPLPCCLTRARASPTPPLPHCLAASHLLLLSLSSLSFFPLNYNAFRCSVSSSKSSRCVFCLRSRVSLRDASAPCFLCFVLVVQQPLPMLCGTLGPRVRQGRLGCVGRALPRGRPPNHPRTSSGVRGREVLCAGCCWSQGAWSLVSTHAAWYVCSLLADTFAASRVLRTHRLSTRRSRS